MSRLLVLRCGFLGGCEGCLKLGDVQPDVAAGSESNFLSGYVQTVWPHRGPAPAQHAVESPESGVERMTGLFVFALSPERTREPLPRVMRASIYCQIGEDVSDPSTRQPRNRLPFQL